MITLIIGTNRIESNSKKVADMYSSILNEKNIEHQIFDLSILPLEAISPMMYSERHDSILELCNKYIADSDKYVFFIPEYNGGYPGILKLFLDMCPPSAFHHKKAALVGLSSGRSGNLRGTDQMTNVLNYLKVNVLYSKPKLSGIEGHFEIDGSLKSAGIRKLLQEHAELTINF